MTAPEPASLLLLVDDDPHLRRSVGRLLRRAGWTVVEAQDGVEALAILVDLSPSVLLTDMRMPHMSGLQLIDAVRERGRELPIVVLSGYHDVPVDELKRRGAGAVLDKPVDPAVLRETLLQLAS
jgi:two-component system response regulator FixJ